MRRVLLLLSLVPLGCGGVAPLRVVAGGDLALGPRATVDPLVALPLDGDVRFANLESPLTEHGEEAGLDGDGRPEEPGAHNVRLAAPPAKVTWLRGRLDVASLANNHALDQGEAGRSDTTRHLAAAGIVAASPERPAVLRRRGREVVVVARQPGADPAAADLIATVAAAARRGAVVLVSLHWGRAGSFLSDGAQRRLARALVDAGAVAVLGHGPHAVQGVERYRRGLIAYSLGNLAFDCRCSEEIDAFLLAFTVEPSGAAGAAELYPIVAGVGGAPAHPTDDPGLSDLLIELSADLGTRLTRTATGRLRVEP